MPRFVIQLRRSGPNMAPSWGPHRPGPKAGAARAGAPPVPVGFQRSWELLEVNLQNGILFGEFSWIDREELGAGGARSAASTWR